MTTITKGRYKDIEAYTLSEGDLAVVVLPMGGKIQSICFEGREYLWQTEGASYKSSCYDTLFEHGEFSGFDDMFPTVSACFYPDGVWQGTPLPDHGEVWALPWECTIEGEALKLRVHGVRLPYLFEKKLTIQESSLFVEYSATNLSPFPMKYIWAAHPLFVIEENAKLELPEAEEIINVYGGCKYLGDYGEHHNWPVSKEKRDMSVLSPSEKCCNKYYVWNKRKSNVARIAYPNGKTVSLMASVEMVPYMGVWVNEGGYGEWAQQNVAPEPCTGAFDALDIAAKFGKVSTLVSSGKSSWELTIEFI